MATFGPPSRDGDRDATAVTPAFAPARLLVLQRALATLTHELGNMTSPVALVADAIAVGPAPTQHVPIAGTLRMIADSLRDTTAICRILRGNLAPGALSPTTFTDAAHWWTLCRPFVADMVPGTTRVHGQVAAHPLSAAQYEPLVWVALSAALFAATTRPGLTELSITGTPSGQARPSFVLALATETERSTPTPPLAREIRRMMAWEVERAGGSVSVTNTASRLEVRITIAALPG